MAETLAPATELDLAGSAIYDAFISYSHAADDQLAPALQSGLQSLGKPWYRRRILRAFRDKTSLSATPELWPTIEQALAGARYFVLLASPEAADSRWVDQEVGWWRANRSASTVLIVLTGGELAWDGDSRSFDVSRTTALPSSALNWFQHEPLWVDLRWAREARHASLRDPRFRDCVADLAAPIRDTPKDELIGEDIRQHRRALQLARGAATLLTLLTALALIAAIVAVRQRNVARQQSRLASARQVASSAIADIPQRLDLSLLLAVEGFSRQATPETQAALFQVAATTSPQLARFADNGTPVRALASFPDGTGVATGGEDGTVRVWDLADGRGPAVIADFDQPVTAVGIADNGRRIAVGGGRGLVAVIDRATRDVSVLHSKGSLVTGIALDSTGDRTAAVDEAERITVFNVPLRQVVSASVQGVVPWVVAFRSEGTELMLGTGTGETSRWSVSPLRRISNWTSPRTPANHYTSGYSADGAWFGYNKFGVVETDAVTGRSPRSFPPASRAEASVIALSRDGTRAAVASDGTISVIQASLSPEDDGGAYQEGGLVADPLMGMGTTITGLAFVGGRDRLISASQRMLALWDLRQQSRIAQAIGPDLPDKAEISTRPGLAISPRDGTMAWTDDDGTLIIRDPKTGRTSARGHGLDVVAHNMIFSPDGSRLFLPGPDSIAVWDLQHGTARQVAAWPYPPEASVVPTRDGSMLIVVGNDGRVSTITTSNGLIRKVAAGGAPYSVVGAAVRPNSAQILLIQSGGGTRLVDLHDGGTIPGPMSGLSTRTATYSPDGTLLAVSDRRASLVLWDTRASRVVRRIGAERVDRMTFSPRGDRLVAITGEGRMTVWDVGGGVRLGELQVRQFQSLDARDVGYQTELAWDRTGSALWTATIGGRVVRWDLNPAAWIRSACSSSGRALTADEWRQNIGGNVPKNLACTRDR